MNNKQLQLVSFEQAKRLKESGFDWYVAHWYTFDGKQCHEAAYERDLNLQLRGSETTTSAPTVALALKWFRDEKKIDNAVGIGAIHYEYTIDKAIKKTYYQNRIEHRVLPHGYDSYELAESALIDELLTLIDK